MVHASTKRCSKSGFTIGADQLGYITWGEFCDWGAWRQQASLEAFHNLQNEWREVVMRDLNHPSIVAWTPYNETAEVAKAHIERHRRCVQETVDLTRALDPTRPVKRLQRLCARGHRHLHRALL